MLAEIAAGGCALLFLAAALGKADSWGTWSELTKEIPGPAMLGRSVRMAVPAVEGTIVVLSFASPTVGLAAGAVALAWFAVGVWLLSRALAGRECNCFGAMAPATISARLAQRNVGLALLAAGGWGVARQEKLEASSISAVIATLLCGAIALLFLQARRVFAAVRAVRESEEVG